MLRFNHADLQLPVIQERMKTAEQVSRSGTDVVSGLQYSTARLPLECDQVPGGTIGGETCTIMRGTFHGRGLV